MEHGFIFGVAFAFTLLCAIIVCGAAFIYFEELRERHKARSRARRVPFHVRLEEAKRAARAAEGRGG